MSKSLLSSLCLPRFWTFPLTFEPHILSSWFEQLSWYIIIKRGHCNFMSRLRSDPAYLHCRQALKIFKCLSLDPLPSIENYLHSFGSLGILRLRVFDSSGEVDLVLPPRIRTHHEHGQQYLISTHHRNCSELLYIYCFIETCSFLFSLW